MVIPFQTRDGGTQCSATLPILPPPVCQSARQYMVKVMHPPITSWGNKLCFAATVDLKHL